MSKDMSSLKSTSDPKTITISYRSIYASLCVFMFALGAFVTVYSIMGDLGFLGLYAPVQRILLVMGGLIVLTGSGNMWLEKPQWAAKRDNTRPKRYTQLRH